MATRALTWLKTSARRRRRSWANLRVIASQSGHAQTHGRAARPRAAAALAAKTAAAAGVPAAGVPAAGVPAQGAQAQLGVVEGAQGFGEGDGVGGAEGVGGAGGHARGPPRVSGLVFVAVLAV
jgi:hypothetical protein